MSIKYIKDNLKKFDHDNLISFLFDIVIRGGLDNVEDFDVNKEYDINNKVYFKDEKGTHHIYKCLVEKSSKGELLQEEWIDLLQSFRKPIINEETIVAEVDIKEEVLVAVEDNQIEFVLNTAGVEDGDYDVVVYHPEHGRLARSDFNLFNKSIVLNDKYYVNKGNRIIVDLYRTK